MSHGTDVVKGRSADVTHLAIHGKVTVKSNSTEKADIAYKVFGRHCMQKQDGDMSGPVI